MTEHRDWGKHRNAILSKVDKGWALTAIAAHYMVSFKTIKRLVDGWRPPAAPIAAAVPEPEPAPAPIEHQAPAPPASGNRDNTERNARIIELAKEGLSAGKIGLRMGGLSRSAVIGVLHRAGISTKGGKGGTRARPLALAPKVASGGTSHAWGAGKHHNALVFAGGTKGGAKPPISRDKLNMKAPETAVPFEDRKGCRWPYGDPREGPLLYCNAPRCSVRTGGLVQTTEYCAEHWALRRSSAYTKIINVA
jgi:GcrA cell cycle regulator